jgi:hypothetical protein
MKYSENSMLLKQAWISILTSTSTKYWPPSSMSHLAHSNLLLLGRGWNRRQFQQSYFKFKSKNNKLHFLSNHQFCPMQSKWIQKFSYLWVLNGTCCTFRSWFEKNKTNFYSYCNACVHNWITLSQLAVSKLQLIFSYI